MCFLLSIVFKFLLSISFHKKKKIVQTDWGGEYRNLNSFFQIISIHHRLIYPHTHEQNCTIEHRYQHIVKTSLTLLGQCSAPLQFWNYVF
jgi:hypothetical protein